MRSTVLSNYTRNEKYGFVKLYQNEKYGFVNLYQKWKVRFCQTIPEMKSTVLSNYTKMRSTVLSTYTRNEKYDFIHLYQKWAVRFCQGGVLYNSPSAIRKWSWTEDTVRYVYMCPRLINVHCIIIGSLVN